MFRTYYRLIEPDTIDSYAKLIAKLRREQLYIDGYLFDDLWHDPHYEMKDTTHLSIAFDKSKPIGVGYMGKNKWGYAEYERHYGLVGVYVKPEYRGCGLAHRLVCKIFSKFKPDAIIATWDAQPVLKNFNNVRTYYIW